MALKRFLEEVFPGLYAIGCVTGDTAESKSSLIARKILFQTHMLRSSGKYEITGKSIEFSMSFEPPLRLFELLILINPFANYYNIKMK